MRVKLTTEKERHVSKKEGVKLSFHGHFEPSAEGVERSFLGHFEPSAVVQIACCLRGREDGPSSSCKFMTWLLLLEVVDPNWLENQSYAGKEGT